MNDKVTAQNIRQALESTYKPPEWYIGFEVGNSTGTNCRRHADAVVINAYPSKGFEIRGFEIKVSKSDLKSELDNGIKSDEIARFCDYWFLVVPKGLANDFTLPPTWGVLEFYNGRLNQKVRPEKLEKIQPTTGFMCAMLRGRERVLLETATKLTADREEQIRRDVRHEGQTALTQLKNLREKIDEIKEKTGLDFNDWTPSHVIIDRLKAAESINLIVQNVRYLEHAAKNLMEDATQIKKAVDDIYSKNVQKEETK